MHIGYWWESHKEDQDTYNTTMDLGQTGWGGMDGTLLDLDRDQWWAPVDMVLNLQVP
jgi:hypothetical protein